MIVIEQHFYLLAFLMMFFFVIVYYVERWWNWKYYAKKVRAEIAPLQEEIERLRQQIRGKNENI